MARTHETLHADASTLGEADPVRLVERLIASLGLDEAVEDAWAEEVARRDAEVTSGAVTPIPGFEALEASRAEFA